MYPAIKFVRNNKIETHWEWKLYVGCHYNGVTFYNLYGEEIPPLPDFVPPNIKEELKKDYHRKKKAHPENFKKNRNHKTRPCKRQKLRRITPNNIFKRNPTLCLDDYMSYDEAREYLKQFNITCYRDWLQLIMNARNPNYDSTYYKPDTIPDYPYFVYILDDSWFYWGHFLGIPERDVNIKTYSTIRKRLSYEEAREFARALNLENAEEWKAYACHGKKGPYYNRKGQFCVRRPPNISIVPFRYYAKTGEWVSWQDFLGYPDKYKISFAELMQIAKDNNMQKREDWYNFAKANGYVQCVPQSYLAEWKNWGHFLGKKKYAYLNHEDAKKFFSTKSFKSVQQYTKWWDAEQPDFLPRDIYHYSNAYKQLGLIFTAKEFLSSNIVEKFNNLDDISVVYISQYQDELISNLVSVSVDKQGLVNANLVIKKKNQILLGMYKLNEDTALLKSIIKQHGYHYSQGENNQYLIGNITLFLNDMEDSFQAVVMPAMLS